MTAADIRVLAYSVLMVQYPKKLSAGEIAEAINVNNAYAVSRKKVHYALRNFARSNKHFAIYPSFFPHRIEYSVYPFEGPFNV